MPDQAYCFLALVLSLGVIGMMTYFTVGPHKPPPVFRDADHALGAWRNTRGFVEKLLFFGLFYRYVRGPALVLFILPFIGMAVAVGTAVCGLDVEAMKVLQAIVRDILDFFREARGQAPGGAG